ncbi:MAG: helix-turn-helix transcriptional regulator [Lachnospiraceae bacterium]
MIFNYDPLWKQLDRKKLSKTDLRTRLGCSTSTLAKLSAGQAVSMDLLVNIAHLLGCGLDDIVELESSNQPVPWKSITASKTFCIRMILEISDSNIQYLSGYAFPYDMPENNLDYWEIKRSKEEAAFYILEGCANPEILRELIDGAEKGETLGQFADKLKIHIHPVKCGQEKIAMARSVVICNGRFVYRPPYMLPPRNACQRLKQTFLPALSPTDMIMLCESLIGLGKQDLYYHNGQPDKGKMERILHVLQEEFPACRSVSDIIRLGNFEVLSYPSGLCDEKCGIQLKVEKGPEKKGIRQNIFLTFDKEHFKGSYALNLSAYDGAAPIFDELHEFYCQDSGFEFCRPTHQLISRVELKVWETGIMNQPHGNLICHQAYDLIMGYSITTHVIENEFSFLDDWKHLVSRTKNEDTLKPRRVSHIGTDSYSTADPYEQEQRRLKKDFQTVMPDPANPDTGCFFPKGEAYQVEYLKWLKGCVNQDGISKVILIDPYIKPKALGAILRCAEDISQSWEIYMDSAKQNGKKRLDDIRSIKAELDLAALPYFSIRDARGKLHDRFIILIGKELLKVYVLSNSIDTMAEKHASAACAADPKLSRDICRYYLDLFSKTALDDIYLSKGFQNKEAPEKSLSRDISASLPGGIDTSQNVKTTGEAKDILRLFLEKGTVNLIQYYKYPCLGAANFLSQDKVMDYQLLSDAMALSREIINYVNFTWQLPVLHLSAQMLFEKDLPGFLEIFKQISAYSLQCKEKRDYRPGFLGVIMLFTFMEDYFNQFQDKYVLKTIFASAQVPVRALTVIQMMAQNISCQDAQAIWKENLTDEDFLNVIVFAIKEIRISPKAYFSARSKEGAPVEPESLHPYFSDALQGLLAKAEPRDAAGILVQTLAPLYPQYSHDIICLINSTWNNRVITKEAALYVYEDFILKRFENSMKEEKDFLRTKDLLQICEFIDSANEIDPVIFKRIRKRMADLERNLDGQLYRPFLKNQNYNQWKHIIDLFGCLVYLELYIKKKYGAKNNPIAVTEYEKICENFKTDLSKYSEIYCAVRNLAENDTFI